MDVNTRVLHTRGTQPRRGNLARSVRADGVSFCGSQLKGSGRAICLDSASSSAKIAIAGIPPLLGVSADCARTNR